MADSKMKILINNIKTLLENAVVAGTITAGTKIIKGIQDDIEQIAKKYKTYVAIDDGGERTEIENKSSQAQDHFYMVAMEIGAQGLANITTALDRLLDVNEEIKNIIELEANKQLDGLRFGITITPLAIPEDKKFFWRGRQVILEYRELEPRYSEF